MRTWQVRLVALSRRQLLLIWGIVLLLGVALNWRGWWGQFLGNVGAVMLNHAFSIKDGGAQRPVAEQQVAFAQSVAWLADAATVMPASSARQRRLTMLAVAWQKQDQPATAAMYWRQLPDPIPYLRLWGSHYWVDSAYGAAVDWYQQAVDLSPTEAYNHYLLGLAQQKLGRLAAAQASFMAAQARLPDERVAESDLLFQLTSVSLSLTEPDWAGVLAQLDAAIALNDFGDDAFTPAQTHYLRGEALRSLSRYEEAAAAYTQAFTVLPAHYMAHVRLGNLASGPLGDLAYAESLFQTAIALDGTRVPAYLGLGDVYERTDRPDEAVTVYQTVLQLQPDNARASQRLQSLLLPAPSDADD